MVEKMVEILVEEPSMQNVLNTILPQILPDGYELNINCFIRPHQGKTDLQKSIRNKVRAYKHFPKPVQLIVVQDQDSNDCKKLKQSLCALVEEQDSTLNYLVRIACRELENWHLVDMPAIEAVYPTFKANKYQHKSKYRKVDHTPSSYVLEQAIKNFAKGFASKNIPPHMNVKNNRSNSFNQFVRGLQHFLKE
jgi:hypothetical protein